MARIGAQLIGRAPTDEERASLRLLQSRMSTYTRSVAALLVVAVGAMAAARVV
jgi:hypothetical protein